MLLVFEASGSAVAAGMPRNETFLQRHQDEVFCRVEILRRRPELSGVLDIETAGEAHAQKTGQIKSIAALQLVDFISG